MVQFLAAHNIPLVSSMFPDSCRFHCKHTKTKAIICGALDPYLKVPVVELTRSTFYNLLCDESNERSDEVKLLTVLVRLFHAKPGIDATRHLDTVSITDLSADGIYSALINTLDKYQLPLNNLFSFTSDMCNVMKGARSGVGLCVKAATKCLPLKVDIMIDVYYHFHYSVNRKISLHEYSEFCSTEYQSIVKLGGSHLENLYKAC